MRAQWHYLETVGCPALISLWTALEALAARQNGGRRLFVLVDHSHPWVLLNVCSVSTARLCASSRIGYILPQLIEVLACGSEFWPLMRLN